MNKIYSIFGARKSKSGKYYNITIVNGKDDKKSLMIIVPLLDVPKENDSDLPF